MSSFGSRDEEEVAGYADLMELVFESYANIPLTENVIRQFHGILLGHSQKDERHRGDYKTLSNSVEAFDAEGRSIGVIFETATPFDTPQGVVRAGEAGMTGREGALVHLWVVRIGKTGALRARESGGEM